jgi:hypothetical protein
MKSIHYKDIHIVEDDEEACQFRYEDDNETVPVGTPVGYDKWILPESDTEEVTRVPWVKQDVNIKFQVFDGIYYCP